MSLRFGGNRGGPSQAEIQQMAQMQAQLEEMNFMTKMFSRYASGMIVFGSDIFYPARVKL
jgi:hypothetical protein